MAVILPNCALGLIVRAHPYARDARGVPMPADDDSDTTVRGPEPGSAREMPDGSWSLKLDPGLWPVRAGDRITDETNTRTWVAAPDPKLHANVAAGDLDYVEVAATLDPPRVP